jgi:hypothetical protein
LVNYGLFTEAKTQVHNEIVHHFLLLVVEFIPIGSSQGDVDLLNLGFLCVDVFELNTKS